MAHTSGRPVASDTAITRLNAPDLAAGVCMVAVAAAAFLPWVSILDTRTRGIDGDGMLTLVCALASLAALVVHGGMLPGVRLPSPWCRAVSGIGAVFTTVVALEDLTSFATTGLYLTIAAGLGWLAALLWELVRSPRTAR
jgi:hypothetical protein